MNIFVICILLFSFCSFLFGLIVVFEPFYTTRKDGLGLGLYVIKQLVEKCGGSMIHADSAMGEGTIFVLKFKTC